jgi:hypothetical protein
VCEDKKHRKHGQEYISPSEPHSSTVPAAIGPKAVFVRPECVRFLRELSAFANVSVWSSMLRSTTEQICRYLFRDLPPPVHILGQEQCDRVKVLKNRKITYLKVKGTKKDLFLKTLKRHLFRKFDGRYTEQNTIIVDDSPVKHILNEPQNVVLLDTWTYESVPNRSDLFLVESLLPYLYRLHSSQPSGFHSFRMVDRIGLDMMREDPFNMDYQEIMAAIELSDRL